MANDKISRNSTNLWLGIGLIIIIALVVILVTKPFKSAPYSPGGNKGTSTSTSTATSTTEQADSDQVRKTVEDFGKELKQVSLLAPDAGGQIMNHYREFVSTELLAQWQAKPELAPGRLVSSPVPDRIEIKSLMKQGSDYKVEGEVVELTSDNKETRQPISLTLTQISGHWLITSASITQSSTDGWKSVTEGNLTFRYPETLGVKYISTQSWPPEIKSEDSVDLNCPAGETAQGMFVRNANIGGRDYCIRTKSEGAAGSIYQDYDYAAVIGGKILTASFTLRYPQCGNYPQAEADACNLERQTFDLDSLIDRILNSVQRST
ncbi:MAG: hypothetical protein ACM3PZ_02920 [Bacillota bacterium]